LSCVRVLSVNMDYQLAIENAPKTIPAGTGILLIHPSTGETDRIDTDFFKTDTDQFLVISTRTTAREVTQKLEYYDVNEDRAEILDTLSVERGYSRRRRDDVSYVSAPDDIKGIIEETEKFLTENEGKLKLSLDSVTELAYYADVESALKTVDQITSLLKEHDAVGLFHLSKEVHDDDVLETFRERFLIIIELSEDGSVSVESKI